MLSLVSSKQTLHTAKHSRQGSFGVGMTEYVRNRTSSRSKPNSLRQSAPMNASKYITNPHTPSFVDFAQPDIPDVSSVTGMNVAQLLKNASQVRQAKDNKRKHIRYNLYNI